MIVTNPMRAGSFARDDLDQVSRGWWVLFATGAISVLAGGIILFAHWTVGDLAVFIGLVLLIRGIFTTFSVPVDGAVRKWSIALGLLESLVGLAVFVWPGPTLLVIAFWIGWYVLFSGIMTIAGSITGRGVLPYWGVMLAIGIFETVFAFWLLARPGLTLVAAVLAVGLWSVVYGVMQIVLAFDIKNLPERMFGSEREIESVPDRRSFGAAAGH
jgi:uncharacterized membrane protein HdeD (DUF308 family)